MFMTQLHSIRERLKNHTLYQAICAPDHLRIFMKAHQFAVWDFMSLAKRLQIELTCTTLPWFSPKDANGARFINQIILGEESDVGLDGQPVSHFDMYRQAMVDVEASDALFDRFQQCFVETRSVSAALKMANIPHHIASFVSQTIDTAQNGSVLEVASSFFFGREDTIPAMFQNLLDHWGINPLQVPKLTYYLERHIELDGHDHGPAAMNIVKALITDTKDEECAFRAAERAIKARIGLWDGVVDEILTSTLAEAISPLGIAT